MSTLRFFAAVLSLGVAATAQLTHQVTYVDADPTTNTTHADGTPMVTTPTPTATDGLWCLRTTGASNNGTLLEANGINGLGGEDAPMLKTTATGLIPGLPYRMYAYFWGHGSYTWSGSAQLSASQPQPPLAQYVSIVTSATSFEPMQPLAVGAPQGIGQTTLGLTMDSAFLNTSGHFINQVKLSDGTGWLFEVYVGTATADANGEVAVYVDDVAFQPHNFRTWFDGIGYEVAPLSTGGGCGDALASLGGSPFANAAWTVDLQNADPFSLALLLVGVGQRAPLDIGLLGFTPGCVLTVDYMSVLFSFTDATGAASFPGFFPALPSTPIPFYWQWAVLNSASAVTEMSPGIETYFHQ